MYRKCADGGVTMSTQQNNKEKEMNVYDDGNIPNEDLKSKNIIPDEVPRKDGPGGEGSKKNKSQFS